MKKIKPVYLNRELSWIDFNARVLDQALKREKPVLERLKFLSIVSSNFDEFFMVRIAALKRAIRNGGGVDLAGMTPAKQFAEAVIRIKNIVTQQYECFNTQILPDMEAAGIPYVAPSEYSLQDVAYVEDYFRREVQPLLTPLRFEEDQALPSIGNLRLHAAFLLRPKDKNTDDEGDLLSIVQIPASLPRIVWLPKNETAARSWTLIDHVVALCGEDLYPGYSVLERTLFKLTRDADFAVDEERDEDFVEAMEQVLVKRELSIPVRLSISPESPCIRDTLAERLELQREDIYEMPGPIDLRTLMDLATSNEFPHLYDDSWRHLLPPFFDPEEDLWASIQMEDRYLHFPYNSFDPVVRFFREAAEDPNVAAIKVTLYRTSGDSPIVKALEHAARNGKQVTALVELKARFDEGRNITWAARLEQAGVIVVYGLASLKVHAKAALVVRRESVGIKRYIYLSTGNFNDRTARLYGDIGYFTCDDLIAYETGLFFNVITGYSSHSLFSTLALAPATLKFKLIEMIEREITRANQHQSARIMLKCNSLSDKDIIDALYRASCAGVEVLLNIRGICLLIPGTVGLSENIRVVSTIDRYLEHARIYWFANGGSEEVYLSSADLMTRNLEKRVELMFPVIQDEQRHHLTELLLGYFDDHVSAYELQKDGKWCAVKNEKHADTRPAQQRIYETMGRRCEMVSAGTQGAFKIRRKPVI